MTTKHHIWNALGRIARESHETAGSIEGVSTVSPPLPEALELWPWLAVPGVVIALVVLREHLVRAERSWRARSGSRPV